MPYYPTLAEDVARAKEILAKGSAQHDVQFAADHDLPAPVVDGGTIYGADLFAAYKLLESFVEAIEAVGPKVAELALRHQKLVAADDAIQPAVGHVYPPMPPSITCPRCGAVSYHPKDIAERYCGACHEFHDVLRSVEGS